ncbi:MAG: SET domain-containing protein-lysine N-methyltransferase [Gammaproteobacteria bacterium]|nr:SET domain-containing protein-lysine N-methyltransferase [Gammaproteobacteria bacterium]
MYPEHFGNNPLFPNRDDFEVVTKNDHSGMGVITYRNFNKGDLIAKLAGEIIHDIRQHSLQIDETSHLYDIYFSGYFLHSCDPNVTLDMKNLTVHALRPIKANEFLYMDYAETEEKLYKQFPCGCNSVQCRGWVTGYNEPIDESDPQYQAYAQLRQVAV